MLKTEQISVTTVVTQILGGSLADATIGVWGFSDHGVPCGTALAFIDNLITGGASVRVFDPDLDTAMPGVEVVLDAYDAARDADVLVTLTGSDDFSGVDLDKLREIMLSPVIVDATKQSTFARTAGLGFSYNTPSELLATTVSSVSGVAPLSRPGRLQRSRTWERAERRSSHWDPVGDWKGNRSQSDHEVEVQGLGSKRAFDLFVGIPLAIAALPLIGLFALGIAVSFRCWPFFTQWRTGRNGKQFRFLKIRTLPPNTPAYAHKFNLDTESLPKLARFLRKQHLDELPQLLLVPLGKMSLVGPRPKMPDDKEPIEPTFGRLRTTVPQGCTGLWQIGEHAHLRVCDSADYDYAYLRHGGVLFDVWILWRTALLLAGKNKPVSLQAESSIPRWAQGRGYVSSDIVPALAPIAVKPIAA